MKDTHLLKYVLILICFTITGVTFFGCGESGDNPDANVTNRDVVSFRSFSINTDTVDLHTNARGTVFVVKDQKQASKPNAQVVAWVEIDPRDWGGVEVGIPQGWSVKRVVSDYPQGNMAPDSYVTTWQTAAPEPKWHIKVDIGFSKYSSKGGSGQGTVLIDLEPMSSTRELPEILEILIGAGSKGDIVAYPIGQVIEVPLK